MYKSETLFLQLSSHQVHTLDFLPNIFCSICIFISCEVVPYSKFVCFYWDSQRQSLEQLHYSSLWRRQQYKEQMFSCPLTSQTQMTEWMGDSDEEWSWNRKQTCSDRKAEMCFLSISDFLQGFNFMTFFPFDANNLQRQKCVYRKEDTSARCRCCAWCRHSWWKTRMPSLEL